MGRDDSGLPGAAYNLPLCAFLLSVCYSYQGREHKVRRLHYEINPDKIIILILGCVMLSSAVIGGAGVLSAKKVVDEESARSMTLMCSEKL